ncbi:hypothetical protein TNCV_740851 [Trichonephila clavipes]|nr:hypothetical protein TNCV_740851 [Trichonephila clavipes]
MCTIAFLERFTELKVIWRHVFFFHSPPNAEAGNTNKMCYELSCTRSSSLCPISASSDIFAARISNVLFTHCTHNPLSPLRQCENLLKTLWRDNRVCAATFTVYERHLQSSIVV